MIPAEIEKGIRVQHRYDKTYGHVLDTVTRRPPLSGLWVRVRVEDDDGGYAIFWNLKNILLAESRERRMR